MAPAAAALPGAAGHRGARRQNPGSRLPRPPSRCDRDTGGDQASREVSEASALRPGARQDPRDVSPPPRRHRGYSQPRTAARGRPDAAIRSLPTPNATAGRAVVAIRPPSRPSTRSGCSSRARGAGSRGCTHAGSRGSFSGTPGPARTDRPSSPRPGATPAASGERTRLPGSTARPLPRRDRRAPAPLARPPQRHWHRLGPL